MAIRNIRRQPTVPGVASGTAAPIYVDSDDNILKMIPAGTGTTEVQVIDASSAQTLTNKTLTSPIITGATAQDSTGVVREIFNATPKTIVDGSATSLFSVAVAAAAMVGGVLEFLIKVGDGTDNQTIAGIATWSAEAKLTVVVGAITYVAANEAKSVSAGTLTLAFTADVSVANVVTYKLQPTGSLTETTPYTITYTVRPISGVVTIL
jgi:hypothetical protein